eukprot:4394227-Heterocapsa_arctica.AAC.1
MKIAIEKLARAKGLGPDCIPAELLKSAADAVAVKNSALCERIVDTEQWPIDWKGGREVDVYKGKNDRMDCNNSRGLTLINHICK